MLKGGRRLDVSVTAQQDVALYYSGISLPPSLSSCCFVLFFVVVVLFVTFLHVFQFRRSQIRTIEACSLVHLSEFFLDRGQIVKKTSSRMCLS